MTIELSQDEPVDLGSPERREGRVPNEDNGNDVIDPPHLSAEEPMLEPNDIENLENLPPSPPAVISASEEPHQVQSVDLSASLLTNPDDGLLDDNSNDHRYNHLVASPLPASRLLPGPQREEPTVKERLIDRERQRRKEAERARLKRQFALMSNGGGTIYDGTSTASQNGAMRENNSVCGTVGEESSVAAHADLDDSMMSPSHHQQDEDPSQPHQLGYTMERFLQERGDTTDQMPHPVRAASTSSSAIPEETIEELKSSESTPPDKGVVMERFLNDPVLLDTTPSVAEEAEEPPPDRRPDDVHRSVSFDMELRTSQINDDTVDQSMNTDNATGGAVDGSHLLFSLDESDASVQAEVAPEENVQESTPRMDANAPLGSTGSMDQGSTAFTNPNDARDNDDGDEEPRVLRLTEAEIQEMAAIEEASIGNAPPSDRDTESLVGDLIGDFGSPSAVGDPAGTTFSQGTPTTAMESGSMFSGGNQMGNQARDEDDRDDPDHVSGSVIDDMERNSMDGVDMSASLDGASLSGSAVSVTANPPSEIIGRVEPASTIMDEENGNEGGNEEDGDDEEQRPPPPLVVGSPSSSHHPSSPRARLVVAQMEIQSSGADLNERSTRNEEAAVMPLTEECTSSLRIREELRASGPDASKIVNRSMRPGMVPSLGSPMRRISSLPDKMHTANSVEDTPKNNRTVDEFDFDKNDFPLSPRSHMSDSVRDLPGDDFWASPGRKMTVSPIHEERGTFDPKSDALRMPDIPSSKSRYQDPLLAPAEGGPQLPPTLLTMVEQAHGQIRANQSATVDAKESEVYVRNNYIAKALPRRLLPLIMTCIIEIPVMSMISGGSDRLCNLLGRRHQQLLVGFIPLIAAVSGNIGLQTRSQTTKAVNHGHISASVSLKWLFGECKVSACLGVGMGIVVGAIAFSAASGSLITNIVFAMTVALAQFISAASSGFTGTVIPIVMHYLLKRNANSVSGFVEAAMQDVISTFVTATFCYYILLVLLSPTNGPTDSCGDL